jgi:fructokinase
MHPVLDPSGVRRRVAGAGFITLDVALEDSSRAVAYSGVGGTTGNVLSILAFFGWHSLPLVHVGADRVGQAVVSELARIGVDTRFMAFQPFLRTPMVFQWQDQLSLAPRYSFQCPVCGNARKFDSAQVSPATDEALQTASCSNVFFFDRVTENTVQMAEAARSGGAFVFFEPSSVNAASELMIRSLKAAHVVKYSIDRIEGSLSSLLDSGFVEIQTMGARGLRFRRHSLVPDWVELPALRASWVMDTAGAGDWCSAGFIHALSRMTDLSAPFDLSYNSIHQALRHAQAVAALSCHHLGARGLMQAGEARDALEQAEQILASHQLYAPGIPWESAHVYPRPRLHSDALQLRSLCCQSLT